MLKKKNIKFSNWKDAKNIQILINSLKNDKIAITSSDTILGLLANLTEKSFELLNHLKGGRSNKPYIILIGSIKKLKKFVNPISLTPEISNLINKCWPGPITIIFKAKSNLPYFLKSKDETIAIRYPDHPELQKLLQNFDGLFSTSANKSSKPAPKNLEEIEQEIIKQVDLLFCNEKQAESFTPSTILDCSEPNFIKIIRKGAYPIEKLEEYYGKKFE